MPLTVPQHKLVFAGPVGSGKSTAIRALSDIAVVDTDARATDETRQRKPATTVAMDYGVMNLPDGGRIHLYGTPGQDRFDFMWDVLTQNGLGLVVLIDNTREDPLRDLQHYLGAFRRFIEGRRLAVGVTRMDHSQHPPLQNYRDLIQSLGLSAQVLQTDARQRASLEALVKTLLVG